MADDFDVLVEFDGFDADFVVEIDEIVHTGPGTPGPPGVTPDIEIGTVVEVPYGTPPDVSVSPFSTDTLIILDWALSQGPPGTEGPPGPDNSLIFYGWLAKDPENLINAQTPGDITYDGGGHILSAPVQWPKVGVVGVFTATYVASGLAAGARKDWQITYVDHTDANPANWVDATFIQTTMTFDVNGDVATTGTLYVTPALTSLPVPDLGSLQLPSDAGPTVPSLRTLGLGAQQAAAGTTLASANTYAQSLFAANDALLYKGVINLSTNPNYPAADAGHVYIASTAGKIGGASGVTVDDPGALIICKVDGSAAGNQAAVGANWDVVQVNKTGIVIGPTSAVDTRIAVFDGVTGKLIKDGGKLISDLQNHSTILDSLVSNGTPGATGLALLLAANAAAARTTLGVGGIRLVQTPDLGKGGGTNGTVLSILNSVITIPAGDAAVQTVYEFVVNGEINVISSTATLSITMVIGGTTVTIPTTIAKAVGTSSFVLRGVMMVTSATSIWLTYSFRMNPPASDVPGGTNGDLEHSGALTITNISGAWTFDVQTTTSTSNSTSAGRMAYMKKVVA